jgi:hypothetical protein
MTAAALGPVSKLACADSYTGEIEQWRRDREASLKADDGWLTVAGLHWLSEGANRVEGAPGIEFELRGTTTRVRIGEGVAARVNGRPAREAVLKSDNPGPEDRVTLGTLTMFVIERSGRYGIRVRDTNSRFRREFTGLSWYPVKPEYRVQGRLEAHEKPLEVSIPTILGFDERMRSPGVVRFRLNGGERTLRPVLSGNRLFLIFKDQTSGKSTYPAGRFLYADPPKPGGAVELDFNKAYNPPCAYTPYATCPLPPRENQLATAVEAGELNYHHT